MIGFLFYCYVFNSQLIKVDIIYFLVDEVKCCSYVYEINYVCNILKLKNCI